MSKSRFWKLWIGKFFLVLLISAIIWVVNLIWFKPFNIKHFYDRVFVELAVSSPELVTQLGIPVLYDIYKDDLSDASDNQAWEDFEMIKKNHEMLLSYNFDNQSIMYT